MSRKLTGHQPGAKLTPKTDNAGITPYSGQHWKDHRGNGVMVTGASIYRVKFTRDGYESPCEMPTERFLKEFTHVGTQTFTEWREANNPLDKTRKLRELIITRREGAK
ncbi:DUF4222 domain-containing protein [Serratia ureilytica]|uniref:DUF4222 domain-containing protein n=1 Tax=Serratia ureilytica TaxID=300181 RepID=UPI00191E2E81|nr:DUF4222 domain-containing protein [Serratia ureilytica]MBL0878668.1 DUF4222 domain-containing protein [Serratia ureilytica]MDN2470930.1 DUF4222 domain-containing protein [Serratia ureilytica]